MKLGLKRKVYTTLLLLLCTVITIQANEVVITNPTNSTAQELADAGYDVIGKFDDGVRLVVSKAELAELEQRFEVQMRESSEDLAERLKKAARGGRTLANHISYDEFVSEIKQLQQEYPNLCKVTEVGKSRGMEYYEAGKSAYSQYNQALWLIKVSDNVTEDEDEPGYMVLGEHHSREPSSFYVSMYVLRWLLENYGTDDEATEFVDNKQIWFMPLVNPNGYTVAFNNMNDMIRKNIRDNNNNNRVDVTESYPQGNTVDGVDLNRNYGVAWGTSGISFQSNQSTYCGTAAFSEPEVACVKRVIDSLPMVLAEMSYHSYSEVVLYSPAHKSNLQLTNSKALRALGAKIAGKILKNDQSGYYGHGTPAQAIGYSASGGLMDYAFIERGIFGYCGELGTKFMQTEKLESLSERNLKGLKEMFRMDENATITGYAKRKVSGTPVPGRILIEEVDDNNEERYRSDSTYGRYFRHTSPGTYTVTFIPDEDTLDDKTEDGVLVTASGITEVDFIYPQETATVSEVMNKKGTYWSLQGSTLKLNGGLYEAVSVYTVKGELLFKKRLTPTASSLSLPGSLAKGIYLMKLESTDGVVTTQFVL